MVWRVFATLVLGVVALILIDRSNSNSILSALFRPNKALAVVSPIVASLLAVTLFWVPARDLFRFGVLEGVWLAVPPLAAIGVLLALEGLKPLWRMPHVSLAHSDWYMSTDIRWTVRLLHHPRSPILM